MTNWITQSWPWYTAGILIALVMYLMLFMGKSFGVSSTLRTMCAMSGAGKRIPFFNFQWRREIWNLLFILGAFLGGWIATNFLENSSAYEVSTSTISALSDLGIKTDTNYPAPIEIFSWEGLLTLRGFISIVVGGFLVGFGTRYAGGCTSGHAISGLSNLQLPSLIAVIGFFIGGLLTTHLIIPFLFQLV